MTLDEKKLEVIEAIRSEFSKLHISIEEGDIRSTLSGNTWLIWIEQKNGLNTSSDKFLVNLNELNEGVNYVIAVGYRVRRWASNNNAEGFKTVVVRKGLAPILIAEDDEDDRVFINKALRGNLVKNPLVSVPDGEQLLDYLHHHGKFSDLNDETLPCLILLDLNMPRIDGREALKIIKNDTKFRKIPVVILTTSLAVEDILNGYDNGVNSYITKPASFDGFVKSLQVLQDYWLNIAQLPPRTIALS